MLGSWETTLEKAANIFTESINKAIEDMNTAISGGFGNLDYLKSAYEK
jgi:hypothetical protein